MSTRTLPRLAEELVGARVVLAQHAAALLQRLAVEALGLYEVGVERSILGAIAIPLGPVDVAEPADHRERVRAAQANGASGLLVPFTIPNVFGFVLHFQMVGLESVPGGLPFTHGSTVRTPF